MGAETCQFAEHGCLLNFGDNAVPNKRIGKLSRTRIAKVGEAHAAIRISCSKNISENVLDMKARAAAVCGSLGRHLNLWQRRNAAHIPRSTIHAKSKH
jgi:hypothetical protein